MIACSIAINKIMRVCHLHTHLVVRSYFCLTLNLYSRDCTWFEVLLV